MFIVTKDSIIAKIWAKNIKNGKKTNKDLPNIQGLKEAVKEILAGE